MRFAVFSVSRVSQLHETVPDGRVGNWSSPNGTTRPYLSIPDHCDKRLCRYVLANVSRHKADLTEMTYVPTGIEYVGTVFGWEFRIYLWALCVIIVLDCIYKINFLPFFVSFHLYVREWAQILIQPFTAFTNRESYFENFILELQLRREVLGLG
jgi:hypothetical protein